jgi:ribonuclease I
MRAADEEGRTLSADELRQAFKEANSVETKEG